MTVMGEGASASTKDLIKLAKAHDIGNYQQIMDEVSEAISDWSSFAKLSNVPQNETFMIENVLKSMI